MRVNVGHGEGLCDHTKAAPDHTHALNVEVLISLYVATLLTNYMVLMFFFTDNENKFAQGGIILTLIFFYIKNFILAKKRKNK